MMSEILTADDVDAEELHSFLRRMYSKEKADFLHSHGQWWHRGNENRWIIRVGGEVAGYCAVIPASVLIGGEPVDALWWVDLVIDHRHRGKGLQSQFDHRIRTMPELKLGFPNAHAAEIHRRHGWGVRDDLRVVLLPLYPLKIRSVRTATGPRGLLLRLGSAALIPFSVFLRKRLSHRSYPNVRKIPSLDPDLFEQVFRRYHGDHVITTKRTAEYFHWRYGLSPYGMDYRYYAYGTHDIPELILIARRIEDDGTTFTRVVDHIGDLSSREKVRELIAYASAKALAEGSAYCTSLTSFHPLQSALIRSGYLVRAVTRFCWLSSNSSWNSALGSVILWTFSDSDNDALE